MGVLVVCGLLAVGIVLIARFAPKIEPDKARADENLRRRDIWRDAGGLTYPHELADGRVQWYRVYGDHAMDL